MQFIISFEKLIDPVYEELENEYLSFGQYSSSTFKVLVKSIAVVASKLMDNSTILPEFKRGEPEFALLWTMMRLRQLHDGENRHATELACFISDTIMEKYKKHPYFDACNSIVERLGKSVHAMIGRYNKPDLSDVEHLITMAERCKEGIVNTTRSLYPLRVRNLTQEGRINSLKQKIAELEHEKEKLVKEMHSDDYCIKKGQEYLVKVFAEYLSDADEMEQSLRKDWFNVLQGLCSIEGVPKEVKKMIQSLKRKPKGGDSMTVNTQTYVETQNNNYK